MADIVEPTVTNFFNETIRVLADHIVGLEASLDIVMTRWNTVISPLVTANADGDEIIDGSAGSGRTICTKKDMVDFITQMGTIQTQFNGGGVSDVINKPHVNPRLPIKSN